MIALTRILVPTNMGEPSKTATMYAVELARRFGARLTLLQVLPTHEYDIRLEAERVVEGVPETGESVVREVARASIGRMLSDQDERDTAAEYVIRPAGTQGPHVAIVEFARAEQIDLIVMGRHRQGRVDHLLTGSVTERVVRDASCPVLVVHHPEHEFVAPERSGASG